MRQGAHAYTTHNDHRPGSTMQLTIQVPDDLGRRVRKLTNPDAFVIQALSKALPQPLRETLPASSRGKSRWARMVEEVEADPDHLDGYSEQLKRDIREVREGFEFKHDREP